MALAAAERGPAPPSFDLRRIFVDAKFYWLVLPAFTFFLIFFVIPTVWLCCKLGEGAMRDQGASCSPYDSALARRSCSHAMASVRAHGPRPKARSTIRASPTMPPWRANIPAWPLRSARITSKPLIVA